MVTKNQDITRLFIPQRTQPPHRGHISMLEAACKTADEVIIGIGSSNIINDKNPYFAFERELMLEKSLQDRGLNNYQFTQLFDFNNDDEWFEHVQKKLNYDTNIKIVSGNAWVKKIFENKGYSVVNPLEMIKKENKIDICATDLREMIMDENPRWKEYAATGTVHYFNEFGGKNRISKFYSD